MKQCLKKSEEDDDGMRWNAIEMAVWNDGPNGKAATRILVEKFPEFKAKDTKNGKSLLGRAFAVKRDWEVFVETKSNQNPIYAFLRW